MAVPEKIKGLIERFDNNIDAYKSGHYNETQVRHEFIDPFFMTLGWDVNNEKGYAETYKDVIHEDSIKVGGIPKAPDYCFRIGGVRKFFLEAKKPSVYIKEDTHPAYQLRRYAWSAKLPLSILTDFEEFAIYDCRVKPVKTDKASTARIRYFTYKEYHECWAEIASIFSHEAILKGSFDTYVASSKAKRGTAEVDKAFLKEIENWRDILARNIALRNPAFTRRELNFSVQRTIDRIIFLRICEDRGIEDYGTLMSLLNGSNIYKRLFQIFYRADERYNSGLFHFKVEKGYSEPFDELTPSITIDDKPIKDIIKSIYYPESPYEFSVLPADILGQVYEQFLGKVIRLTSGHRAVVEDKPEVKKAGGVYYTPTYIVNYIVKNTVEKLLEGKTPKQAEKLKILDPACGSGSFLIGAYQYLLDWHREWYEKNNPEKWAKSRKPRLYRVAAGDWRLTTDERKRILLNNIYGVDIDTQAVEVTKLSLLLKVLEGENDQTLARQYKLFHERALPNLSSNIKCGNSLIGPDFYDGKQIDLFDDEERYRINVFDWEGEFAEIFKKETRKLWFVTFVTHNSRISERMLTYGVKSGNPLVFIQENLILIAEKIAESCKLYGVPVVAWSVLPDHVHMVLAASNRKELNEYVRKIKGYSSYAYQRALELDPGGKVWAQKFHSEEIIDETSLNEIINYIYANYEKHREKWGYPESGYMTGDERENKGLKPLVKPIDNLPAIYKIIHSICVPIEKARYSSGGFDIVIGNPPYIRIQGLKEWSPKEVEFYKQKYTSAGKGNYDIYAVFVEKGLGLLKNNGLLGFILPHKFFNAQYGLPLRILLSKGRHLFEIVHFGDKQLFKNSTTYTCLLFLDKSGREQFKFLKVNDVTGWKTRGLSPLLETSTHMSDGSLEQIIEGIIPASKATSTEWNFVVGKGSQLFEKLSQMPLKLGAIADIFVGLQTSADSVFLFKKYEKTKDKIMKLYSKEFDQYIQLEYSLLKSVVRSGNIGRYWIKPNALVLFPYKLVNQKFKLISENEMEHKFIKTWKYLIYNKKLLSNREHSKFKYSGWYQLYPKNIDLWEQPKILLPYMIKRLSAYYDDDNIYFVNVTTGGFGITINEEYGSMKYFTGILNSILLDWYLKKVSTNFHGGYFAANKQYLAQLPIHTINFSDPANKSRHDRMVNLVEQMLSLHKQLSSAKTAHDKEVIQRQIDATDKKIDNLVYELYGLTEEEIKIVEEATENS